MKKTTNNDFQDFKYAFMYYAKEFGVLGYNIIYQHIKTDCNASIEVDMEEHEVMVTFSDIIDGYETPSSLA